MNDFYKQPVFLQWVEAVILLLVGFYPALVIIECSYLHAEYALLFILYLPIGQFSATPFFKLTGIYHYYSPMLIGMLSNKNYIDLHSGGSFDYWWVMRKTRPGAAFRITIMMYHLEGLLNLISQIETNKIPMNVVVSGTSYFIGPRTLRKLGFENKNPGWFYRLNLFANAIDLIWMYSLSKGKFAIPQIWNAVLAQTDGKRLVENKKVIQQVYHHLQERQRKLTEK